MAVSSIGDLATSTMLRSQNSRLQSEMDTLVQELSSGKVSIRDTALGGSYRAISGIQTSLKRLEAFELAATEAEGFSDAMQSSLGSIQEATGNLSVELLAAGNSGTATSASASVAGARQDFEAIISWLNTSYAGRTVFGGVATDTSAIADASDILSNLETEITASGAATVSDVEAVVRDWFAAGSAYLGSSQTLSPMTVGAGQTVEFDITAQNQEIQDTLSGIAMAIFVDSPSVVFSSDQQVLLAERAGEILLRANQDLLVSRADVGALQETIEDAQVEMISERTSMDLALSELMTADPYDRATKLTQIETQIEMLYTLTVRTSNLNLTNFL
ncbi:flagellin [Tropicimonas sp. TH_r6]|uniref:flagellin n=1 Tax=Tropicimonas sp. TH_r6 TaxID=3082085 RepID=UPI0029539983|nr:flagellin [Tropicimonas sp. TH_r6]MDV7144150.1 flagellin [Tropicimonas sp. TH_r6]